MGWDPTAGSDFSGSVPHGSNPGGIGRQHTTTYEVHRLVPSAPCPRYGWSTPALSRPALPCPVPPLPVHWTNGPPRGRCARCGWAWCARFAWSTPAPGCRVAVPGRCCGWGAGAVPIMALSVQRCTNRRNVPVPAQEGTGTGVCGTKCLPCTSVHRQTDSEGAL